MELEKKIEIMYKIFDQNLTFWECVKYLNDSDLCWKFPDKTSVEGVPGVIVVKQFLDFFTAPRIQGEGGNEEEEEENEKKKKRQRLNRLKQYFRLVEYFDGNNTSQGVFNKEVKIVLIFKSLFQRLDIIINYVLREVLSGSNSSSSSGNNINFDENDKFALFRDDEQFRIFYTRSKTFRKLYELVLLLSSSVKKDVFHNNTSDHVSTAEKMEIKRRFFVKQKKLYGWTNENKKRIFKQNRSSIKEAWKIYLDKKKKKKLSAHVNNLVYLSFSYRVLFCTIFSKNPNLKNFALQGILLVDEDFSAFRESLKLDKFYRACVSSVKSKVFKLNMQSFIVKNIISDSEIYQHKYEDRRNYLNNIIYRIDPKYIHLLWDIIDPGDDTDKKKKKKKASGIDGYKALYRSLYVINSEDFTNFLKEQQVKMFLLFKEKLFSSTRLNDLFVVYCVKTWFEKVKGVSDWGKFYLHMDLFQNEVVWKYVNGGGYPVIVNLFSVCWGVYHDGVMHFGNIVHVLFKYKEIFARYFDNKIQKTRECLKEVSIKDFLY
jgi:hypothetical protein